MTRKKDNTRAQRTVIAKAFTEARRHIDNCEEGFICNALFIAYLRRSIDSWAQSTAREIIRTRMGGEDTLECWLQECANVPTNQLTNENMRAYRLRWLDALIKEFSK